MHISLPHGNCALCTHNNNRFNKCNYGHMWKNMYIDPREKWIVLAYLMNDSPLDATLIGNAAQTDTIANMLVIE